MDTAQTDKINHHACFVAGTLVHTKDGLKAIQDIKVGDIVLSRDEDNPDGELAYKKVLNTFKSPQKEKIAFVDYMTERGSGYIFCTENHPFWADKYIHVEHEDLRVISIDREPIGWTLAKNLDLQLLKSFDKNTFVMVATQCSLKKLKCLSKNSNYAAIFNYDGIDAYVDFAKGEPLILVPEQNESSTNFKTHGSLLESEKTIVYHSENDPYQLNDKRINVNYYTEDYEDYVYNLEVADYHTYFVGNIGIWVHNCDPNTTHNTLETQTTQNG